MGGFDYQRAKCVGKRERGIWLSSVVYSLSRASGASV